MSIIKTIQISNMNVDNVHDDEDDDHDDDDNNDDDGTWTWRLVIFMIVRVGDCLLMS